MGDGHQSGLLMCPGSSEWHDVKGEGMHKKRRWAWHDMLPVRGSSLTFLRVWRRRKRDCRV